MKRPNWSDLLVIITLCALAAHGAEPVIFGDYSDPDVVRAGDDYYLVASSFDCVPGLPILHSRDLVHWTLISYAADRLPSALFNHVQPGGGLWAPSIRLHDGFFWIYVGDPDRGIFMTRARDPRGPWEPLALVKEAKGWIDPCPLWDDDGSVYLVHAWAKSRAGFNGVLTVNRMSADGRRVLDDGTTVFDGAERHPTIEGPKFYKRNGWYYIFAPAGGVKNGWQTVLRSKSVYGPYEDKIVLERGEHQGAWVSDWFIYFKDRGAYGRLVHLRPMTWVNDWPEMGEEVPGQSPLAFAKPELAWQRTGNFLLQKFPAEAFTASTTIDGLVIFGADSSALVMRDGTVRRMFNEQEIARVAVGKSARLQVTVTPQAVARFSVNGKPLGGPFVARPGVWIGAKVGVIAQKGGADALVRPRGASRAEAFHIEIFEPKESASLIVAQDGSGDFRTVQEALDAIPRDNSENRTILIRNGVYREKVRITTSHVSLVGEDRDKTRIEFAELRRNWRASHPDDFGAAVINIDATDVILANLTVHNDYGGDHDHQFAIRSMERANRIAILHANVIADGGDTVSLWNAESGLSYYDDSYFEGWVDFVCPRGWAYITNSRFFGHNENASIWHDGSKSKDAKLVIRRSRFDGVPNFALGRNHRDAQFYLLDATFSANMADRAIYPAPAPDPRQWGERYYYSNAHRDGGDFSWFADNLSTARDEDIDANWTFGGQWDPANLPAVLPFAAIPRPENGARFVDPAGVTLRWTPARNARASVVHFNGGTSPVTGPLEPGKTYSWSVDDGPVWSFRADPRTTRIALVGDSTVTEKSGWGRGFKSFVDQDAALFNFARGGRSSKSYSAEGHWKEVLRHKPTHVLIQFGHNDVPGKGLDRETDLPAFRANMARYVDEARAIGAIPILVTPLTRRNFKASDLADYAAATKDLAAEKNVPLIDLHAKSIELLDRLGPSINSAISPLKSDGTIDKTHLNDAGSALFGALMAQEARRFVPHLREATLPTIEPLWSVRMADSVMKRTPDPLLLDVAGDTPKWDYTQGLVLLAIQQLAHRTGDARYDRYVKAYYDTMIEPDGRIRAYDIADYSLDRINAGKVLFELQGEKFRKAIETLRQQLRDHPRNADGGFWHKKRYPHQMWLDGLYMGAPFLAQYAKTFNEPAAFDDVIQQFVLMEQHARDEKSGLLYHGWDESREQRWSDPKTGRSPATWGRAMGWYAMGLIETLDYVPRDHPRRRELIAILQRLAEAITKVQDPKTGVWWQVLDQPGREGNYLESSASAMFSFVLLKASRLGYIDPKYAAAGRRAYNGVLKEFVEVDANGLTNVHRAVAVVGLGGDPEKERYRDGTYEYYVTEKVRSNDPKAVGPFIFASLEMER